MNSDVIIIGAGVAGLSAAIELSRAGLSVSILEARNRIGGRVYTLRDPKTNLPIELGAEFVHGLVPEIWQPLQERNIALSEVEGDNWCVRDGELRQCDFFEDVDNILKKMKDRPRDRSFLRFLEENFPNRVNDPELAESKDHALRYISGFNAADPRQVSVNWLVEEMRAEEQVEGDRVFRIHNGYEELIDIFERQLQAVEIPVKLNHSVDRVRWGRGKVKVTGHALQHEFSLDAPRVLITVPLGVLLAKPSQKGSLEFMPKLPAAKEQALDKLASGHVIRMTLVFRERFWKRIHPPSDTSRNLSRLSFLFSDDAWFPTWWTQMPEDSPVITAWAPFKSADRLSGKGKAFVTGHALASFGRLLKTDQKNLRRLLIAAHFHDWQTDPFARGAYSYVKIGGKHAPKQLGQPVQNTLFFAGEATDTTGHTGTVHGAIASGKRAAGEILSKA